MSDELQALDQFLEGVYLGQDRLTNTELQRSAVAAELPADLTTRIDALPEGSYTVDEASEALHVLET